jgi:hypothetical protein
VHDPTGKLLQISRVMRPRAPLTEAYVDRYLTDQWEPMVAQARGTPLEARIRELGEPVFADSMPAYAAVVGNRDGGFWARRDDGRMDETNDWDVFDRDGRYLGPIELPLRFEPRSLSDSLVAGIARDENDVEFVDVYGWTISSHARG